VFDPINTAISVAALGISAVTAWLIYGRRGTLRMSQPAVIYFGPDGRRIGKEPGSPKIYLRALIFATAKRGRIIESMHATLYRDEARQNFHVWVYGNDRLSRGSGLFVGETGVAADHHFLTSRRDQPFVFSAGAYVLEVYAKLLGDARPLRLLAQRVHVGEAEASALRDPQNGLYFDWGPDAARYIPHIDRREPPADAAELLRTLGMPLAAASADDEA
jgi:hypothetical protein